MTDETYIELCVDCGMFLANGTIPYGDESEWAGIAERWDGWHLAVGNCPEEDCECVGFTMSPCDGCGSRLGGSRYHGAAWRIEEKVS